VSAFVIKMVLNSTPMCRVSEIAILGGFAELKKSDYYLRHVCLSV